MLGNQLVGILNKDPFTKNYFLGLFPSDWDYIPQLQRRQVIVVITTIPVNHYLVFLKEEKYVEYFDPEGKHAEFWGEDILQYLLHFCPDHASAVGNQNLQSPFNLFCGCYCIYYIRERCLGIGMIDVMNSLRMIEDEQKRDHHVFEYVKILEIEIAVNDALAETSSVNFFGLTGMLFTVLKIHCDMEKLHIKSAFCLHIIFVIILMMIILVKIYGHIAFWILKMDCEPMDVDLIYVEAMDVDPI